MYASETIASYRLPPELRARTEAYARAHHLEYVAGVLWGLAALVVLLQAKIGPRARRFAERVSRRPIVQAFVFAPLVLASLALLETPLALAGHVIERAFGISVQGWGSFARDWVVAQALGFAIGGLLVWILYWALRRSPRRWWFWSWLAVLPVLFFVFFIEPWVIEPLFFKFAPLAARDPALVARLQEISSRAGSAIPADRMFVMEASEKVRAINAYVTGFGASKRVVIWDTTLRELTGREIEFIFGHELGHYVLGHVWVGLVASAGGLLVSLFLAAKCLDACVRRFGAVWGFSRASDLATFPLVLLLLSVFATLASPLDAAFTRRIEHAADAFGLHAIEGLVDDPRQAAAHAFQRLGEIDLAEPDPSPLAVFWLYDHPPIRDRIAFVLGN
jgi:Zn-dependent protease with chaperone function